MAGTPGAPTPPGGRPASPHAPCDDFDARVIALVAAIPPGRVMTYGQVAAALGSRAARQVGKVMAYEGGSTHWWRVVRAGGAPAPGHETRALEQYRVEGTPVVQGRAGWRVDMRRAAWSPDVADCEGADPGHPVDPC